jgi:hypothetical protein
MILELSVEECLDIMDGNSYDFVQFEPRHWKPLCGPGKNVMSGSVGFTKTTYNRLGGVDYWYCGHGAYADSDFHLQAAVNGCRFVDLELTELHFPHSKLSKGKVLSEKKLRQLSLDNFIYYCLKWGIPKSRMISVAKRSMLKCPVRYVNEKIRLFSKEFFERILISSVEDQCPENQLGDIQVLNWPHANSETPMESHREHILLRS